jgi:hypothetical protein
MTQIQIIQSSPYVKVLPDKLVFLKDSDVIGEYNPEDPDGGRTSYFAAKVKVGTQLFEFFYQSKGWAGLQVFRFESWYVFPETLDKDDWPDWVVQEDEQYKECTCGSSEHWVTCQSIKGNNQYCG